MIIVLSVCKIIGIVLLILLAVLAALLFLPVTYVLDADIEQQRCSFKIRWLFGLIRFRFLFEEKAELVLSVLFFRFDFLDEEKRARRKNRKDAKKKSEKEEQRGGVRKAAGFAGTLIHVIGLVRDYALMDAVWPGLARFLYRIRPGKVCGRISFGIDDPAATGQVVGALALIPLFYQTDLRILPDFETDKTYIGGNVYIKGHMMLFYVVALLVGWFRQRDFRQFIGALRNKR